MLPSLFLENTPIEYQEVVKNLGMQIDSMLSWHKHIDFTVSRVYQGLKNLWRHAKYTPRQLRERLVKALLVPIITYGDSVYCNFDSACRRKLNVAFNACTRYIFGLQRYDHVSVYSSQVLGCNLNNYLNFRWCLMMYKILNNLAPNYLQECIQFLSSRRTQLLLIPKFNTKFSTRAFFVHVVRIWNGLPLDVRTAVSFRDFRIRALDHFANS